MILKIGVENGCEYIQTKGNVRIKYFKPMVVFNSIYKILDNDENWNYETNGDFLNHLIEILAEKQLKEKAIKVDGKIDFRDKGFWEYSKKTLERLVVNNVTNLEAVRTIGLNELIDDILDNQNYPSDIVVLEYESPEISCGTLTIIMYNKFNSYLLNDNGQTVDVIK